MKVCTLNFEKNVNGAFNVVNSQSVEVTADEMKNRMSTPLAMLTLRRIAVRNSKNYDKTLLSKEIGMFD
jgi:hypothetical protein